MLTTEQTKADRIYNLVAREIDKMIADKNEDTTFNDILQLEEVTAYGSIEALCADLYLGLSRQKARQ